MNNPFVLDLYPDACCEDCDYYERIGQQRCDIAEEAFAFARDINGVPYNFGAEYKIIIPASTSHCNSFEPSRSYLLDLLDATSYYTEQRERLNAIRMGKHV